MIRTSSGEDLLWFLCLCCGHSQRKRNQLVWRAKNYGACMGGFHVLFSEAYAMPKEGDTEHVQAIWVITSLSRSGFWTKKSQESHVEPYGKGKPSSPSLGGEPYWFRIKKTWLRLKLSTHETSSKSASLTSHMAIDKPHTSSIGRLCSPDTSDD